LVVVAAIGLAALLLQVRFRRDLPIHSPVWLNVLGILCAMVSLFADYLRMTRRALDLVAFAAVVCFGISGSLILHALRRRVRTPQSTEAKWFARQPSHLQCLHACHLVRCIGTAWP
jgi:uncharacterized membrane protein